MLQIKNVNKEYKTGELVQTALDDVSLALRDNEFVAILGPSGSGKTTLLNVIGGLDRYDSGELIINGISTKRYKSRDWDSYRNHTIGFVFQSYNLIEHQSILSNVEIALTISGVKRKERRRRAKEALEKVGLGDQLHKRPNQLSGGQMQRVAIARALVNNPDVLLADEPTGALDSETSIQVMELLKEVASDRLVVMVTHNPELAERYANRIVNIRDGKIIGDTNPYEPKADKTKEAVHKNMGKSSMSRLTALTLSFNNLLTKKGRTTLTSVAGSIGIIGIALILSLSTGVNNYINSIQRDTMASYPITIEEKAMNINDLINLTQEVSSENELNHDRDAVYSDGKAVELESTMVTSFTQNNLTKFKKYLDNPDSEIHKYIGENGVVYSYNPSFSVFTYDPEGTLVNTDGSTLYSSKSDKIRDMEKQIFSEVGFSSTSAMTSLHDSSNFSELLPAGDGKGFSRIITDNYEVIEGSWPQNFNEVVLVMNENNEIPITVLYKLGMLPASDYEVLMKKIEKGEEVKVPTEIFSYEEMMDKAFTLIPTCDLYKEKENGTFTYLGNDTEEVEKLMESAVELKVSGIIRPVKDAKSLTLTGNIAYSRALTDYLISYTDNSPVVKAQLNSKDINVLNGMKFSPANDEERIEDTKQYIANMGVSDKAKMFKSMVSTIYMGDAEKLAQLNSLGEVELAAMLDQYMIAPEDEMLLSIYKNYISTGDYDENMSKFGVVSLDAPSSINIYADNFEDKEGISESIEEYNKGVAETDKITYTDYVGLLMSSVTTIVNIISYVLIAFVSVSLVVSSIMIGIITYISVLERTNEIGILRAMGASKKNISQVFISETLIVGLFSGLIGVGLTILSLIPINAIIHAVAGTAEVNAVLPVLGGVILVVLSMALTVIGGLIPSKKASRMDPVTALRSK